MNATKLVFISLVLCAAPTYAQKNSRSPAQEPIQTSVCKILEDPSAYNNKMVRVRGLVEVSFEYSLLKGEKCSEVIWFVLGGAPVPGLAMTVSGRGSPGGRNAKGVKTPPVPIRVIKDSNYDQFMGYLETSANAESCINGFPSYPPECKSYRVTATFIGRIDSVSRKTHLAHLKKSPSDLSTDGSGFGQMGMFEAQLVVQSIEEVAAVQ